MDCSTIGFPVLHHLPEFAQTHVHWANDAIQPSHPLSPPFSCPQFFPASGSFPVCTLFASGDQFWSFSISSSSEYSGLISFRIDWFDLLAVKGAFESLPAPQFKSISSLAFSLLYGPTVTSVHNYWESHSFDCMDLCQQSDVSAF